MKTLIFLLSLAMLGGCMNYRYARVGEVGESINDTLYQQIADKRQAADPGTEVSPTGTDGPLLESVLDGYRGVKGDAAQVAQPIQINVGN